MAGVGVGVGVRILGMQGVGVGVGVGKICPTPTPKVQINYSFINLSRKSFAPPPVSSGKMCTDKQIGRSLISQPCIIAQYRLFKYNEQCTAIKNFKNLFWKTTFEKLADHQKLYNSILKTIIV